MAASVNAWLCHQPVTTAPAATFRRAGPLLTLTLVLSSGSMATAQVIFQDDFNGPSLNPVWQAAMPSPAYQASNTSATTNYLGAPAYSFQTVGGSSVIRLADTMTDHQRRGWSTSTIFTPNNFQLDLRFNTLVQSSSTSIDGFVELWLIDPSNSSRYDIVSPYGGNFDSNPTLVASSSIDQQFAQTSFHYANNTWFYLKFQGSETAAITAQITDDSGDVLFSHVFNHTLAAFPNGFEIGISQSLGTPGGSAPSDVAIDSVTLTTVPEPGSLALLGTVAASAGWRLRRRVMPRRPA